MKLPKISDQKSAVRDQQNRSGLKTFLTNPRSRTPDHKGFTLIELLIVIALISILTSIGFASFTQARKQARDSQREADLRNIQGALEQYYANNNQYPGSLLNLQTTYLRQVPKDPLTNATYNGYILPANLQSYCVWVDLETKTSADPNMQCPVNGTNYEYMVSSRD